MKLTTKSKTIISIALFVAVFVALLLVATFCDFQISQILTKNALADGEYYATDFFGVFFEIVGSQPVFLFAAFVCCVLFWFCIKVWKMKPFNIILAVVFAIGSVVAYWFAIKDIISYIFDHVFARIDLNEFEKIDRFYHSAPVVAVEVFVGVILAGLSLLATKQFKEDTLKKLFKLCVTAVVAVVVANILIAIVKNPIGRMRYRSINSTIGDGLIQNGSLDGFTRWYVINGQPNEGILKAFEQYYMVDDAFKSFPSGHTCAAATAYCIMFVPDLFDLKKKKGATLACWIVPIAFTMLVAISRIVVGAHYMSDVLFGGTIAFVCMMIAREVLICKGSHFFALFPKLQRKVAGANDANDATDELVTIENDNQGETADVESNVEIEAESVADATHTDATENESADNLDSVEDSEQE